MTRRRQDEEGILELMVEFPWWFSVLVGGILYVGMRYVVPAVVSKGGTADGIAMLISSLAPFALLAFGITAFFSAIKGASRRMRKSAESRARIEQGIGPCPQCGSQLVLKTARRGANAGQRFWGCASFPHCRYVQDYAD
jgi:hypothetical protein